MCSIFFVIKQKKNKELSKDIFRVFQHELSCHVPSVCILVDLAKFKHNDHPVCGTLVCCLTV
jgi:hypothetical protein